MSTPKFDLISTSFATLINDSVTDATTDGTILTASKRNAYVNKALFVLFNQIWSAIQGDKRKFVQLLPELATTRTVSLDANAKYTIASPNLDYFALVGAVADSKLASVQPSSAYPDVSSGVVVQYSGSASYPVIIEIDRIFYVFPAASFGSKSVVATIIKQPLDPTTGNTLTQNGSYDSPFSYQWTTKLTQICEQLFRADLGETTQTTQ